jgi:hypothetical protein
VVEHGAAQRGDERVIRQARAVLVVEHRADLAQERKGLGRELEPDRMHARLGIRRVVGPIAGAMVGDEILDLAQVLAAGGREPRRLGHGRCHARQLAHRRERELATCERRGELG